MKDNKSVSISIGGGFFSLLAVAFIVLKLCHVINWSWIWVLSPIWIPLCLVILIVAIVAIIFFIKNRK